MLQLINCFGNSLVFLGCLSDKANKITLDSFELNCDGICYYL